MKNKQCETILLNYPFTYTFIFHPASVCHLLSPCCGCGCRSWCRPQWETREWDQPPWLPELAGWVNPQNALCSLTTVRNAGVGSASMIARVGGVSQSTKCTVLTDNREECGTYCGGGISLHDCLSWRSKSIHSFRISKNPLCSLTTVRNAGVGSASMIARVGGVSHSTLFE